MLYSLHGHIRRPCLHDPSPPVTSETRCPVSHPSPHCFQLPHNGLGWWSNASPSSHHSQPQQYAGKGPVRQWDSVFIQCPSPYAVHLRVGNLYIKTFFPCDIYLYFHNFPQNIKNRSQADVKSDIAPPGKLLLHSRESAKHWDSATRDSASPASAGVQRNPCARGWVLPLLGKEAKYTRWPSAIGHPLLLDTEAATPPLKKPMDWFWPPSTTAPPHVRHPPETGNSKENLLALSFCYSSSRRYFRLLPWPSDVPVPPPGKALEDPHSI